MSGAGHTTRRGVLGAAGALPAVALATMAAPIAASATPSLAAAWAHAAAFAAAIEARPGDPSDEEQAVLLDLEAAVLRGVITCRADALAKLKAVALSFERGELRDGSDARALADATAWLEAH